MGSWGKEIPSESGIQGEAEILKDVSDFHRYACAECVLDRRNGLSKDTELYKIKCAVAAVSSLAWLATRVFMVWGEEVLNEWNITNLKKMMKNFGCQTEGFGQYLVGKREPPKASEQRHDRQNCLGR